MTNMNSIVVSFSESGVPVCTTALNQIVSVTFTQDFGDLPDIYVSSTHTASCGAVDVADYDMCGGTGLIFAYDGDTLTATTGGTLYSIQGTKESEYCSNRGQCDLSTGVCTCYTNYDTSDGNGNMGNRGDCGYVLTTVTQCPGEVACSGHGFCQNSPTFKCTCSVGWHSGDCSLRSCPTGKAWFDLPTDDERAHQLTECSNQGICDHTTGQCACYNGFEGSACQYRSCPGSPTACSGHGQCLTMAQLANKATSNGDSAATTYGSIPNDPGRWDYDMMQGCLCDEGYEGYDCSLISCPRGDDPDTGYTTGAAHVHERQVLRCTAEAGAFALTFRQQITTSIAFDADLSTFRAALIALSTIDDVSVTYSSGLTFCDSASGNVVTVDFLTQLGDVPPITVTYLTSPNLLTHSGTVNFEIATDGASLGGITSHAGTMENQVCSNRGLCDHTTGTCKCFSGYASGDGSGSYGTRGDCSYKLPYPYSNGLEVF